MKALTNLPGGRLADRIGHKWTLLGGWTLYAAAYAMFPFAQTISDRVAPEASVAACVKKLKRMGYAKVVVGGPAKGAGSKGRSSKRRP